MKLYYKLISRQKANDKCKYIELRGGFRQSELKKCTFLGFKKIMLCLHVCYYFFKVMFFQYYHFHLKKNFF